MAKKDIEQFTGAELEEIKIPAELERAKEETAEFVDPLEALLGVDTTVVPSEEVFIPRLKTKVKVQAPEPNIYKKLMKRCTTYKKNKKTGGMSREFDNELFQKLLIFENVVNPNLREPRLLEKYGINQAVPEDIVEKAFYPGEQDRLADAILTLGGYTEDLVEVGKP